jgi:hypothetical protein
MGPRVCAIMDRCMPEKKINWFLLSGDHSGLHIVITDNLLLISSIFHWSHACVFFENIPKMASA